MEMADWKFGDSGATGFRFEPSGRWLAGAVGVPAAASAALASARPYFDGAVELIPVSPEGP